MNGGYQTLDLRKATAGDPVTIKGAFEIVKGSNGKTILVEDKDGQEVFAQSKEVDGDYVITYISAEGKTVKVTITDEDVVTTVIEDDSASIEALGQAVNEINSRVDADSIVPSIDITSYDGSTEDKMFTAPTDGYIRFGYTTGTGKVILQIYYKGTESWRMPVDIATVNSVGYTSLFVKAGMAFKLTYDNTITSGIGQFYGIE